MTFEDDYVLSPFGMLLLTAVPFVIYHILRTFFQFVCKVYFSPNVLQEKLSTTTTTSKNEPFINQSSEVEASVSRQPIEVVVPQDPIRSPQFKPDFEIMVKETLNGLKSPLNTEKQKIEFPTFEDRNSTLLDRQFFPFLNQIPSNLESIVNDLEQKSNDELKTIILTHLNLFVDLKDALENLKNTLYPLYVCMDIINSKSDQILPRRNLHDLQSIIQEVIQKCNQSNVDKSQMISPKQLENDHKDSVLKSLEETNKSMSTELKASQSKKKEIIEEEEDDWGSDEDEEEAEEKKKLEELKIKRINKTSANDLLKVGNPSFSLPSKPNHPSNIVKFTLNDKISPKIENPIRINSPSVIIESKKEEKTTENQTSSSNIKDDEGWPESEDEEGGENEKETLQLPKMVPSVEKKEDKKLVSSSSKKQKKDEDDESDEDDEDWREKLRKSQK